MAIPYTYWIDVAGSCNLRCPSCPTGNSFPFARGEEKTYGVMDAGVFSRIIRKIAEESQGNLIRIELYNWGEPLIHPKLPEFIKEIHEYENFRCGISSNLSVKADLRPIVEAKPHWFRVSLSGFYQSTYSKTHVRGDVRLVKSNLYYLRYLMDKLGSEFPVDVVYHLYKGNVGGDVDAMYSLCQELSFRFSPIWASFYPLEKISSFLVDQKALPSMDMKTIDELVIKPEVAQRVGSPWRSEPCRLQENQTAINFDGSVQLCCATYSRDNVIAESYLDIDRSDLDAIKLKHPTCDVCISNGLHSMMMYKAIEELDKIGNESLGKSDTKWIFNTRTGELLSRYG